MNSDLSTVEDRLRRDRNGRSAAFAWSHTGQHWQQACLVALLVVAAAVRFWGLGSFGLHKPDEDTTVLPAVHILEDGTPRFPSGMLYGRAVVQSYLIAASARIFGTDEWAFRLPSVLCGLLLVVLAYPLGRRFLAPAWNLVFVAVVALLPGLVADSQEARMYIFLSVSLAAFLILVFRWERTGRAADLVAAVLAMLVAMQFQEIALFESLVLLFPGLVRRDAAKLRAAVVALVVVGAGYLAISETLSHFFVHGAAGYAPAAPQLGEAPVSHALRSWGVLIGVVGLGAPLSWWAAMPAGARRTAIVPALLLLVGLILQALVAYHLAFLCVIAGLVLARRQGAGRAPAVLALLAASVVLAAIHVTMLQGTGLSVRKIIGVLAGQPSIWPFLQSASYSPVAAVLAWAGAAAALWQLANRRRPSESALLFLLGYWVPLFVLGTFGWYFPPRYTEFALLPMLLCAVAAAQPVLGAWVMRVAPVHPGLLGAVAALLCSAAIVNPSALARSVNAGASFADHRGAAQFMRSIKLGPRDIVVAEEVLMQTYYLGHVDYWLVDARIASSFVQRLDGQVVDVYTHTPVIDSAAALSRLIETPGRGAIYVIGSGENQDDGRQYMRGEGISQLLNSSQFKLIYVGADHLTKVWKVDPPGK